MSRDEENNTRGKGLRPNESRSRWQSMNSDTFERAEIEFEPSEALPDLRDFFQEVPSPEKTEDLPDIELDVPEAVLDDIKEHFVSTGSSTQYTQRRKRSPSQSDQDLTESSPYSHHESVQEMLSKLLRRQKEALSGLNKLERGHVRLEVGHDELSQEHELLKKEVEDLRIQNRKLRVLLEERFPTSRILKIAGGSAVAFGGLLVNYVFADRYLMHPVLAGFGLLASTGFFLLGLWKHSRQNNKVGEE